MGFWYLSKPTKSIPISMGLQGPTKIWGGGLLGIDSIERQSEKLLEERTQFQLRVSKHHLRVFFFIFLCVFGRDKDHLSYTPIMNGMFAVAIILFVVIIKIRENFLLQDGHREGGAVFDGPTSFTIRSR